MQGDVPTLSDRIPRRAPDAGPAEAGQSGNARVSRGTGPGTLGRPLGRGFPLFVGLLLGLGCGRKPEAAPAPAALPGPPPQELGQEAAAAAFQDLGRPYPERVAALVRLRTLAAKDPKTDRRFYDALGGLLRAEVSRVDGLSLSEPEQEACLLAASWMADFQDPGVRVKMEFYLDRDTLKRKRLPEEVLRGFALALGKYPASPESRDVLWSAFQDPRELPSVRAASMKALEAFFPRDLEERILRLAPEPQDRWLRDLQKLLLK
jgi:hypothetical protein